MSPRLGLGLTAALAFAATPLAAAELRAPIVDPASMTVDADTVRADGILIRLVGLDAVENDQTCGADAWSCGLTATALVAAVLVAGAETGAVLVCEINGRDYYNRPLGRCHVNGLDLTTLVLCAGFAVAESGATPDEHACADRARDQGLGMWAGDPVMPDVWRDSH